LRATLEPVHVRELNVEQHELRQGARPPLESRRCTVLGFADHLEALGFEQRTRVCPEAGVVVDDQNVHVGIDRGQTAGAVTIRLTAPCRGPTPQGSRKKSGRGRRWPRSGEGGSVRPCRQCGARRAAAEKTAARCLGVGKSRHPACSRRCAAHPLPPLRFFCSGGGGTRLHAMIVSSVSRRRLKPASGGVQCLRGEAWWRGAWAPSCLSGKCSPAMLHRKRGCAGDDRRCQDVGASFRTAHFGRRRWMDVLLHADETPVSDTRGRARRRGSSKRRMPDRAGCRATLRALPWRYSYRDRRSRRG